MKNENNFGVVILIIRSLLNFIYNDPSYTSCIATSRDKKIVLLFFEKNCLYTIYVDHFIRFK